MLHLTKLKMLQDFRFKNLGKRGKTPLSCFVICHTEALAEVKFIVLA